MSSAHAVLLSISGGSDISRGPIFGEQVTRMKIYVAPFYD
jgi:hypothetical protein